MQPTLFPAHPDLATQLGAGRFVGRYRINQCLDDMQFAGVSGVADRCERLGF